MQGQSPVVAVMPTGSGKSMLFMLPALCSPGGITIVVVPLIALREDMQARCEKMGINCTQWNPRRPIFSSGIVLVTPEAVLGEGCQTYINQLKSVCMLDYIFIDEAHVVLNDQTDFRKQLQELGRLVHGLATLVLLTATLPPQFEAKL